MEITSLQHLGSGNLCKKNREPLSFLRYRLVSTLQFSSQITSDISKWGIIFFRFITREEFDIYPRVYRLFDSNESNLKV